MFVRNVPKSIILTTSQETLNTDAQLTLFNSGSSHSSIQLYDEVTLDAEALLKELNSYGTELLE